MQRLKRRDITYYSFFTLTHALNSGVHYRQFLRWCNEAFLSNRPRGVSAPLPLLLLAVSFCFCISLCFSVLFSRCKENKSLCQIEAQAKLKCIFCTLLIVVCANFAPTTINTQKYVLLFVDIHPIGSLQKAFRLQALQCFPIQTSSNWFMACSTSSGLSVRMPASKFRVPSPFMPMQPPGRSPRKPASQYNNWDMPL